MKRRRVWRASLPFARSRSGPTVFQNHQARSPSTNGLGCQSFAKNNYWRAERERVDARRVFLHPTLVRGIEDERVVYGVSLGRPSMRFQKRRRRKAIYKNGWRWNATVKASRCARRTRLCLRPRATESRHFCKVPGRDPDAKKRSAARALGRQTPAQQRSFAV